MGDCESIIRCSRCSLEQPFERIHGYYYVHDDEPDEWPIDTQDGWCAACGTVATLERLPTLYEIETWIADLEANGRDELDPVTGLMRTVALSIEKCRRRERWIAGRRSPPRCLACGSTDVAPAAEIDGFLHPGCGGRLSDLFTGVVSLRAHTARWTPEGNSLTSHPGPPPARGESDS